MPSAIPSGATAGLPPTAKIDPRGHRFGAGVSAIVLIVAIVTNSVWLVALALLSIGVSAAFGLRYSIYGVFWRRIVRLAKLGPTEPEHEYPPRFAHSRRAESGTGIRRAASAMLCACQNHPKLCPSEKTKAVLSPGTPKPSALSWVSARNGSRSTS